MTELAEALRDFLDAMEAAEKARYARTWQLQQRAEDELCRRQKELLKALKEALMDE